MYAEQLNTPHQEISNHGVEQEPLLKSKRLKTIKAAYRLSPKTYDDQVEAAKATANLVRQTLRFGNHLPSHPPLNPKSLKDSLQIANCHGHSIVASECLEEVGIDHRIGFANQHSFLLLESPEFDRVDMIDTAVPQLYIDVTPAFLGAPMAEQDTGLGSVNVLRGDVVLERSRFANKELALAERPWMSFANENSHRFKGEESLRRANSLMMRSYGPSQGRALLESYANFAHAVSRHDYDSAHDEIVPLKGIYPDIDRRNRLKAPTQLVRALGRTGRVADALDDIRIIEESLWPTDDLSLQLWPADCRRKLGVVAGQAGLLDDSIVAYENIIDDRNRRKQSTASVRGRLTKARLQREQLSAR